jgi:SAM-dependent methyltransferase
MKDWESYWDTIYKNGLKSRIFWDIVPESASQEELQRFQPYMNPDLPLLDLGCGNGGWTRFLSRYYKQVIGVDISSTAIQLAKEDSGDFDNIEYRVFDAVDMESARELHREFGDLNIYMRGVLHMVKMRDRKNFIESLEILLGEGGVLYQIELPTKAFYNLRTLPEEISSLIPRVVKRVGFNLEDRAYYFPDDRWAVIAEGENVMISTIPSLDGEEGGMPANYLIMRRKTKSLSQA